MARVKRVLFFAEAVTLAHVARPIVLARALDRAKFEPIFACHPRCERFLGQETWQRLPLNSIESGQFLRSLERGSPVYDLETLRRYVKEDLAIIERVKPDLIVGDFRLSLSVSARLAGIPYAAVTNAYWSPYVVDQRFPMPVLPMTRVLPLPVARFLFKLAQPLAFAQHCKPLNQLRLENNMPSLGPDLRRVYTDADHTLYADVPDMFPTRDLPDTHHFLGPVLWSPPATEPAWWNDLPTDKPVVYLTLGSSGASRTMEHVICALTDLPVTVIASTAGGDIPGFLPPNTFVANYLPGTEAAARAEIVVCNGGSLTCQQAIAAGVPVLGIVQNMDQLMNMGALVGLGAGQLMRADRVDRSAVRRTVTTLLASVHTTQVVAGLRSEATAFDVSKRFDVLAGRMV